MTGVTTPPPPPAGSARTVSPLAMTPTAALAYLHDGMHMPNMHRGNAYAEWARHWGNSYAKNTNTKYTCDTDQTQNGAAVRKCTCRV